MRILDAARYFIFLANEENKFSLTPLKLQKLLYFAQGWSYVWDKQALFREQFEAWQYGPVNPEVYDRYKIYGDNEIPSSEGSKLVNANEEQKYTIELVWDKYKKKNAFKLVEITHQEKPWIDAYRKNGVISNQSIRNYYEKMYH